MTSLRGRGSDKLIIGAPLAVAVAAVIQLLGRPELDVALIYSLCCFAVSIPLLSGSFVLIDSEVAYQRAPHSSVGNAAELIGMLTAYAGIVGVFWHLLPEAALIFLCSSLFSLSLFSRRYHQVRQRYRDRQGSRKK